jgi:uncharacterized membrane-anchored protein YjiN (DUF445 family)
MRNGVDFHRREFEPPEQRRAELSRMSLVATALLVAMTVLYAVTKFAPSDQPLIPYLRAFAEAGMVGACADWFAVVALFRRPLGLPIPHTGIVPANKDRIAEALGRFIANNFLTRRTVNRKLLGVDVAGMVAAWIADPENSQKIAAFCTRALPELIKIVPERRIREVVDDLARRGARSVPVTPLAAHLLETLWANGEAQELLDRAIVFAAQSLIQNKERIGKRVAKKSPRWLPKWVDAMLVDRVVTGLISTLSAMRNPDHPWRRELHGSIEKAIKSLATDPQLVKQGEEMKARALADPVFLRQTELMWRKIEEGLFLDLDNRGEDVAKGIDSALSGLGEWLLSNPDLVAALNRRIRLMALRALPPRRAEIGAYIAEVVRNWDTETLVDRLELSVGRDLQYIRVNGTLVGGLVGLLIFMLSAWIERLQAHVP